MNERELDIWWNGLDYDELYRLIYIPDYEDDNDFIDKCDEYWEGLTAEEKENLYNHYQNL
jgi:hypothetical protein